jgi:hypothetical protein
MKVVTQQNDPQHNVSVVMLSAIYAECRKLALFAECHYAECIGVPTSYFLDGFINGCNENI